MARSAPTRSRSPPLSFRIRPSSASSRPPHPLIPSAARSRPIGGDPAPPRSSPPVATCLAYAPLFKPRKSGPSIAALTGGDIAQLPRIYLLLDFSRVTLPQRDPQKVAPKEPAGCWKTRSEKSRRREPKTVSSWSVEGAHLDQHFWRIGLTGISIPFAQNG